MKKTDREILQEKVDEYYKIFISKNEKSILTYLLYAVYYLKNKDNKFNYNDLLRFLNKNKDNILSAEIYMKLIYLCYCKLESNRIIDKRETLNLLDESYKKIAFTNLKINIDLKTITEKEVKDIINSDKIIDKIDDVLWYLYNGRNSNLAVSWLRN